MKTAEDKPQACIIIDEQVPVSITRFRIEKGRPNIEYDIFGRAAVTYPPGWIGSAQISDGTTIRMEYDPRHGRNQRHVKIVVGEHTVMDEQVEIWGRDEND